MWDWEGVHPQSLLGRLGKIPDPRRRQARVYPLPSILAMLVLAAAHGESSLRGMWVWATAHWECIAGGLGFWDVRQPPVLTTVWNVLGKLDEAALEAAMTAWVREGPGAADPALSIDTKYLRGSKRHGEAALEVVTVVGQRLKQVLGQERVKPGDEIAVAVKLLRTLPLEGKVVSMDAGTLQRRVATTIIEKKGPTSDY
jgi:hypothetical protein